MYLLIKPLGSVAFRWGGVSSILLSGSVSTGFFEPLPLPSTIYGMLKYAYIINGLGQDAPSFKGPMFYAEGEGKVAVCVSLYPQSLYCNVRGEMRIVKIEEDLYERRIGIALNRAAKTVKEGYIYMEKMLDLYALARMIIEEEPKRYGVLVEVNDDGEEKRKKLNGFIAPFGGESRPAVITVEDDVKWSKVGKRLLASPAIIDWGNGSQVEWRANQSDKNSVKFKMIEGQLMKITRCCGHLRVKLEGIESIDKVTYRLISLGFDRNRRLPMMLALMPTVEIEGNYDAIGKYTERGWGSIIEL